MVDALLITINATQEGLLSGDYKSYILKTRDSSIIIISKLSVLVELY